MSERRKSGRTDSPHASAGKINKLSPEIVPRKMLGTHEDLKKVEEMENKYDEQYRVVFEAIHQLLAEDEQPKSKIGF